MYFVDSQKTTTRRDSSLILPRKGSQNEDDKTETDILSTARAPSTVRITSESVTSYACRPKGSVQKELVTAMFESMLNSIVMSWEIILSHKPEESTNLQTGKTASELTFTTKKKKTVAKSSRTKRSHSRLELEGLQVDPLHQTWWCGADERAIIRFQNGNIYEGSISMKRMHGEGRFQWSDGTIYVGHFKDNEINGRGVIQWKDDTWYDGDFAGNLRHGKGLYVDSRKQRSYSGGWHCGTKHGDGVIYYSGTFNDSYDGQWALNIRHGYGSREYCALSGYKGNWDKYVREGHGLMIWPNHDFYRGEWKNGVMSGYGVYIWDAHYNSSMSLPSINAYRGLWSRGQRNGYGVLNLGLGLGSHYKGDFKNNKKHGAGKFVTNSGFIIKGRNLFLDDNIGALPAEEHDISTSSVQVKRQIQEPYKFDICDNNVGFLYHIEKVISNIDRQKETIAIFLTEYLENNKNVASNNFDIFKNKEAVLDTSMFPNMEELIAFEQSALRKSIQSYEIDLKQIYYKYATICNSEKIHFTPVLVRLYLWQFYYDCNVHEKGLTFVEIDEIFYENPEWLARTVHNPFEKIYFWQFLHSIISVASRLYAKRQLPRKKPDTILAKAFRSFMEQDVLSRAGRYKGCLANGFGTFVPLKGTYQLYRTLGEPHTVRTFMQAIRRPPHKLDQPETALIEVVDDILPIGYNAYVFGDELAFVIDENIPIQEVHEDKSNKPKDLKLFNLGNLSSRTIVNIFSSIFPQLIANNKIINLDIQITFFEFFEALILCAQLSIQIKDEDFQQRENISGCDIVTASSPNRVKPK